MGGFALAVLIFFLLLPNPNQDQDPGREAAASEIVIGNVRIFDGEQVLEDHQVRIADGVIQAVEADTGEATNAAFIDGEGGFLMPGLIDSHVHVFGQAREGALRFGVTGMIDMFSDHHQLAGFREQRRQTGPTTRADVWSAGTLVTAPKGHGTQFGLPIPTLDAEEDAAAFIAERLAEGSDFIKLVYESGEAHGFEINRLSPDSLRAAIQASQELGQLAVVHIGSREEAREALAAGADGLVHGFADERIDEEIIELLSDDRFVIPTLTVIPGVRDEGAGDSLLADESIRARLSPAQKGSLETAFPSGNSPSRYHHAEHLVRTLADAGVPILAGSDAPNPGTAHGASLHEELERLVAAGLTPREALMAATVAPAQAFGLTDRGYIRAGYRADLVLVNGHPLENITHSRQIRRVWKNGHEIDLAPEARNAEKPAHAGETLLLSDFESSRRAAFGQDWEMSTDQQMGGQSQAGLSLERETDTGFLRVQGEIRSGFHWPYAGTIWFPSNTPMAPVNLSDYDGLEFRLRGNRETIQVLAFSSANPGGIPAEVRVPLEPDWKTVRVRFSDFRGVDPTGITGIGLFAGPETGEFRFDMERVTLKPQRDSDD